MTKYPFTAEIRKLGGSTIVTIPPAISKLLKENIPITFEIQIPEEWTYNKKTNNYKNNTPS